MRYNKKRYGSVKKSQMEIMGLMIVVILLIVGVLFAVKFIVLKKAPETRQMFTRTQLASNMGMAILESTTANCRGMSVKDLLMDCASWPGGTVTCNDAGFSSSCEYANTTIAFMLNATGVTWNTRYQVKSWISSGAFIIDQNNRGCTDKQPGESESFFLPTKAGTLNFKVFICE
jgi:hypothetical protein